MARDFKKVSAVDETPTEKIDTRQCSAFGCPMHGSIANSVTGSDMWMCSMHFRAHSSNWQTLTQRLRQHMTLVNLIREIRQAQNGRPFDFRDWMVRLKATNPELIPNDDDRRPLDNSLSMRKWQSRLEKTLFAAVMPGMEEEIASHGQAKSSEAIMSQIDEFLKKHSMEEETV